MSELPQPYPRSSTGRPLRVLLVEVNEDGTIGGSHQVLLDVVRRLDRRFVEPVVLFYQDNPVADRLRQLSVDVKVLEDLRRREVTRYRASNRFIRYGGLIGAIATRARFLGRHRIDLVHINNSPQVAFYDWLPAARARRVPIVVSAMGDAGPIEGRVRRSLTRTYSHYIAVSEYMRRALISQGIPSSRITLVQNGIDAARIRSRIRRNPEVIRGALDVRPDQILGLMVGNIRRWKGQHVVLEALARLPIEIRGQIVIAFAGAHDETGLDYQGELEATTRKWKVTPQIRWLGRREDIPDLFNAADFGLHASIVPEPFGLVMVECMATGTPVIAAQEGGAAEIVTAETGWVYPGGDAEALASLLRTFPLQRKFFQRFVEACQDRAGQFDAAVMAEGVQDVYLKLSGGRRRWK